MMDEQAKEVMRITRTGIWVNPDIAVDEVAKAVLESIDENIKFLVQRAVEDEREACAKVCDEFLLLGNKCSAAIRARGEK